MNNAAVGVSPMFSPECSWASSQRTTPASSATSTCCSAWRSLRVKDDIVIITLSALASLIPLSVGTSTKTMFGAIALETAGGTVAATLGVLLVMPAMIKGQKRRRASAP